MLPGEAIGSSEDLLVDEMEDNLLETEFNFLANDEDQTAEYHHSLDAKKEQFKHKHENKPDLPKIF
jgi:hypothetical protein